MIRFFLGVFASAMLSGGGGPAPGAPSLDFSTATNSQNLSLVS